MSHRKKRNGKKGRGNSSRRNLTQQIIAAAKSVVRQNDSDDHNPIIRLVKLIEKSLELGTDAFLDHAMVDLSWHGFDDAALLLMIIRKSLESSTTYLLPTSQGTKEVQVHVFLIPVLIGVEDPDDPDPFPLQLSSDTVDHCGKSFRRHGLVNDSQSVLLLADLFLEEELPQETHARRDLLRNAFMAMRSETVTLPSASNYPFFTNTAGDRSISLHYLLMATFSEGDEPYGPLFDDPETDETDEETDQFSNPIEAWRDDCEQSLWNLFHHDVDFVQVGFPLPWEDAFDLGARMQHAAELGDLLSYLEDEHESLLSLVISTFDTGEDTEVRITIYAGELMVGGYIGSCYDEPETEINGILSFLDDYGMQEQQISVLDGIEHTAYCPNCRLPLFHSKTAELLHIPQEADDRPEPPVILH